MFIDYKLAVLMQTELSKIVQTSEEIQIFVRKRCVSNEMSLYVLCWIKIVDPPTTPLLITKFYAYEFLQLIRIRKQKRRQNLLTEKTIMTQSILQ